MPYGYTGKILWVDLSEKALTEEEPDEEVYRKYLGGYGLGVYYIYTRIKVGCDPLGPDNILGFVPGLFTGTPAPFTGRFMVCGKSPLTGVGERGDGSIATGGWGDSNSGGYFGPAIRRAGYDAIFVTGASDKPVYLLIDGDTKELKDASELWGKDAVETDDILKNEYKGANVVSIGKAGENVCLNAGIVNDHGRIAARSGLGAVMGSKKLKAICIRGRNKIEVKDKEFAIKLSKKYRDRISKALKNPVIKTVLKYAPKFALLFRWFKLKPFATPTMYVQLFHYYGTPYFYSIMANIGDTPLKNWKGYWKDYRGKEARKVSGPTYLKYKVKQFGCYNCPVQCGAILSVDELNIKETHRPEYETIAAMGALQLNSDILSIIDLNEFLNRHGMDSISAGNILSFTLECVEHGLLKKEDFKCQDYPEGFLPTWGDPTYYKQIIKMVVNREGIGDILADGVKKASEKIEGSAEFAMNFNGQEPAMHDSRYFRSLAMSYITDPTPGRHTAASVDFLLTGMVNKFLKGGEKIRSSKNPIKLGKNQAIAAKNHQWFNSLGFCEFSGWTGRYPVIEMIKAIFDWDITPDDLYTIGWRIQTLRQMFNAREGAIMHKATGRLLNKPPIEKGPNRKRRYDMKAMITSYYKNIGFGENGVPLKETLEKLNLDFAIKDLDIAKGDSTYP